MRKLFICSILIIGLIYVLSFMYEEVDNYKFNYSDILYIRVKRSNGIIENIPFEDYIVGVVASEMPVSFDIEALKAQAVASRSYALTKMEQNKNNEYDVLDTVSNQVYLDKKQLKEKWKSGYDNNIYKIEKAVLTTNGEILMYDGKVVNAFFFSTSVGKTENCLDVFGTDVPYLVSVSSTWDQNVSPVFSVNNTFTLNDFYAGLDIPYSSNLAIDILDTTSTGRIKRIKINGFEFKGSEVASKLSLRSSFFTITQDGEKVYITTKGYGHGVGMSQYGAYGMAKEGYKYDEILKHYYTGAKIVNM